eukprot:CAMPEP_0170472944 /NCGR_PEP_ID=MMETSP0123-20130129/14907_1 /TAXON_ID=182087 /ORGANISM="Favella ehrenbergii, Strain Fehren 1" /LENGTH=92 /DNA_ID=CAMNT_0010741585 /DNA_START=208 /DNA_END=486 /DNA_ORIENTATION=+
MSNGSLMRITPLAVWARNLSLDELEQAVEAEVSMTHSKVLLKNSDNPSKATLALEAVREFANREGIGQEINDWLAIAESLCQKTRNMGGIAA